MIKFLLFIILTLIPLQTFCAKAQVVDTTSNDCDFNGDGKVGPVEQDMCENQDIRNLPQKAKVDLTSIDCDFNGDGKVGPVEQEMCKNQGIRNLPKKPRVDLTSKRKIGQRNNRFNELSSSQFIKISEVNITPPGHKGYRPDVVLIDDTFYVAYKDHGDRAYNLLRLDKDLKLINPLYHLYGGDDDTYNRSDLRVAKDSKGRFWYTFETAIMDGKGAVKTCDKNFLNAAIYEISGPSLKLFAKKTKIAKGCIRGFQSHKKNINIRNREVTDDPDPFFFNSNYYIMTRSGTGEMMTIRSFNQNLRLIEKFHLNLKPIVGGVYSVFPSSLVDIKGKPYLVASAGSPPLRTRPSSELYLIPLSLDLKRIDGKAIEIGKRKGEYHRRVVSAKYSNDYLYVGYISSPTNKSFPKAREIAYLEVFDVKNGSQSIGRIFINQHARVNMIFLQIAFGKIYVFDHDSTMQKIRGQIFKLK